MKRMKTMMLPVRQSILHRECGGDCRRLPVIHEVECGHGVWVNDGHV